MGVQWMDAPKGPQNYPPTAENAIFIAISSRLIKLVPISWEIHDRWNSGLEFLLKKWKRMDETPGKTRKLGLESENLSPLADVEILSDSDTTSRHRRIHTIISTSNKKLSNPKTIRKQHYRKTTASNSPVVTSGNPFITNQVHVPKMFDL